MRRARPLALLLALALGACAAHVPVDGARALRRVERQVAAGPRVPGTPGHDAVRDRIAADLRGLGAKVELQSFADTVDGRPLALTNVIGRFGPAAGRRVALLAHYDSRPWCDRDPDPARRSLPLPGANDGGSGVAVLLEVAEVARRRPPPIGVDLVFLDGEDLGREDRPDDYCRGARGYAARLPAPGDAARPVAGFLFDMVGDRDLGIWDEGTSAQRAASLVDLVHEAARATGARHFHAGVRYTLTDDHVPLLDAGLPAVDVIDFDYPAWHTSRDLPDRCSAASLAEVARVACWIAYRSALAGR